MFFNLLVNLLFFSWLKIFSWTFCSHLFNLLVSYLAEKKFVKVLNKIVKSYTRIRCCSNHGPEKVNLLKLFKTLIVRNYFSKSVFVNNINQYLPSATVKLRQQTNWVFATNSEILNPIYIYATWGWKSLLFQTWIIWCYRVYNLICRRTTTLGCKHKEIRKSGFVPKNQLL